MTGEWISVGDPDLAPNRDPGRSRDRLIAAELADDREGIRTDVLRMLDAHGVELADRGTAPGHLTGSALVVDAARERVLLLLHRKLGRWLQPGGHADGDHELAGVALKEATEETGIVGLRVLVPAVDLDVHAVDHGDELGEHLHLDLRFVVEAPPGAVEKGNHESLALRWVRWDDIDDVADEEGLRRLARQARVRLADAER